MEPPRRVLLLGEGNFSFAASLCEAAGTHVVATCYESEEEVTRRGRAAQSIRRLRERGAAARRGSAGGEGGRAVVGIPGQNHVGGRDGGKNGVANARPFAVAVRAAL